MTIETTDDEGAGLLEVIVAFVILGLSLTILVQGVSIASRSIQSEGRISRASLLQMELGIGISDKIADADHNMVISRRNRSPGGSNSGIMLNESAINLSGNKFRRRVFQFESDENE